MRQSARDAAGGRRRVAGADDRDGLPVEQVEISSGDEQRRRIFELREQPRIKPLTQREPLRTKPLDASDLALSLCTSAQRRRFAAASARQVRHGRERVRRRPEARDQLAIGNGSNAGSTQQPQAIDEVFDPTRGSVPFERREMFSRCFHRISNAKPSSIKK